MIARAPGNFRRNVRVWAVHLFVFAWPLAYFHELFAHGADSLALGNDFEVNYYRFKVYLLDALSRYSLPFWAPSEAAGFPFVSNPFAQVFYPLNLPLTIFYRAFGGYSALDHQVFTLLGVSIFALGSFRWLLRLGIEQRHAVFAVCVISVSFKIADILRFPNAVHTAAWLPWVLLALTRLFQASEPRRVLRAGIELAVAILFLLSGAYIYYAYYAPFLFGPYVLLFFLPGVRDLVGGSRERLLLKGIVLIGSLLIVSIVALPYYGSIYQLLGQLQSRGGQDLAFATQHGFGPLDTLGSLVFPRTTQPAGCFYIGILPLLLIALYFATPSMQARVEGLARPPRGELLFKIIVVIWLGTITSITYGQSSDLFMFLWDQLPSFARLRVWGRMNILFLPLLAWVLARAAGSFEATLSQSSDVAPGLRKALLALGSIYGVVLATQVLLLALGALHPDWELTDMTRPRGSSTGVIPAGAGAAAFLLLLLAFDSVRRFATRHRSGLLGLLLLVTAIDLRSVTIGVWSNPFLELSTERRVLGIAAKNLQSFEVKRSPLPFRQYTTLSLSSEFNVSVLPDWHLKRYVEFLEWSEPQAEARESLLGRKGPQKLFVSPRMDYDDIESFLDQASPLHSIDFYDGDRLRLEVVLDQVSYLSFIDNWSPNWRARVDGRPVPVGRLFGTFKTVRVPAGVHLVEFFYEPAWGWPSGARPQFPEGP